MVYAKCLALLVKLCVAAPASTPNLIITTVVYVVRNAPVVQVVSVAYANVLPEKRVAQVFVTIFKRIAITVAHVAKYVHLANSV